MSKKLYAAIILRCLFMVLNGMILLLSYSKAYYITFGVSIIILLIQLIVFLEFIKSFFDDIEKSVDCLLMEDFTTTIPEKKRINSVHLKTALLIEKQRQDSVLRTTEELIFTNILESISIGILILKKDQEDSEPEVFQINQAFADFMKIPKFYNWQLLKNKLGNIVSFIDKWEQERYTVTIQINNEPETFFLKTSLTKTNNYEYLLVSLETVQQIIDKKEKETWYKLMNVMSHEIINTITPISSLAENLSSLLKEETTDENTILELDQGLEIIKRRSYHLTTFVDSYRKLIELPAPKLEKLELTKVVTGVLELYKSEFTKKSISIEFSSNENLLVLGDKQQLEQVFINLISNCIYATENTINPKIYICLFYDFNNIQMLIKDNGTGIAEEIEEKIFIPYFTTRKNGSGIGLTLSKSILQAHKGSLRYVKEPKWTTFMVTMPIIQRLA